MERHLLTFADILYFVEFYVSFLSDKWFLPSGTIEAAPPSFINSCTFAQDAPKKKKKKLILFDVHASSFSSNLALKASKKRKEKIIS